MDQPGLSPEEHAAALRGLRRINRISRTESHLIAALEPLIAEAGDEPLSVLDVACGGGDVVCDLARRAAAKGWNVRFSGADFSEQALEIARENAARQGLEIPFFRWDAIASPLAERFDVVMCTLFLHHLSEDETVRVLRHMADSARRMVMADDLVRSRFGYWLAQAGCRLLSRSYVVHFDGPVSVRSAFDTHEIKTLAESAGLTNCRIRKHWPERYLLTWRPQR